MPIHDQIDRIIAAGITAAKTNEGRSRIDCIQFCHAGYAEPGYDDPRSGVIAFGNWNDVSKWNEAERKFESTDDAPGRVAKLLEKLGVDLEWSDEWLFCNDCGKAVRSSPTSYGWKQSFSEIDGSISCCNCITENPTAYLESMEGNSRRCVTLDIDLAEQGYVLLEGGFENGFHYGQDADPKVIGDALETQGISRFIFRLDSTGQFDMSFSVWVHQDELSNIDDKAWANAPKDGPSVANGLQRALNDANRKLAELPVTGINVATCDVAKGTARVRTVSRQDFLDGNALDD